MLSDNPKALDGVHPIINEKLSNAGAKVLSIFGGSNPYTGNAFKKRNGSAYPEKTLR